MGRRASTLPNASSWQWARAWLVKDALPLWSTRGFDEKSNSFQERLSLEGAPVADVPRRVMVQARQIYSYATAARHSWMSGADELVGRAMASMVRDYFEADGNPGWVNSVNSQGRIADTTRDLYAHAFIILALATAFRITQDEQYLVLADKTLLFLDSRMFHKEGGYISAFPQRSPAEFLQNPHMHLLEALLALYSAVAKPEYQLRLERLFLLLERRFIQPSTDILCEYFSDDWKPVEGERGRLFEPGHHFEWAWLLCSYSSVFCAPLTPAAKILADTAQKYGFSPTGLIWSEVRDDGAVLDSSIRLWPHTEALKSALALGLLGQLRTHVSSLDKFCETFLKPAYPGGWHDRFSSTGELLVSYMPASSLYHIVCAFAEIELHSLGDTT